MSIIVNGTKLDYTCDTSSGSTFVDCNSSALSLDITNKTVTFQNATVINTDTDALLKMNGTLTWETNTENGGNNGSSNGENGNATELEGTWSTVCQYDAVWEAYDTGTFSFSGKCV